jgi:hypothetical protein
MSRWIDTLTALDITNLVEHLADVNVSVEEAIDTLEKLFVPVPHWSDSLDAEDKQTWVLCWLSDKYPKETQHVGWVSRVNDHRYVSIQYDSWKYATPVDLNLRYGNGEDTL